MVLRKITIDNSVGYIPITEKTKEEESIKNQKSWFTSKKKKTKNHHKTIKVSIKKCQHQDLLHSQIHKLTFIRIFLFE